MNQKFFAQICDICSAQSSEGIKAVSSQILQVRKIIFICSCVHFLITVRMRIPIPRDLRVCNCCDMNTREDELHVFECFLYRDLRQSFGLPTINTGYIDNVDAYMRACMNNTNNTAVQNKDF